MIGTNLLPGGGLAKAAAVAMGDVVLVYNEATGQTDYYPVVATITHEDPVVQYLTIDGEIIITTPNHPFYTAVGEWVPAGKLRVGDAIRRADGRYGLVQASAFVYQPQPMYNLTVAAAHTYFVGDERWLVHNANACPAWLHRSSLTPEENDALNATIAHIRNGTRPANVRHWGRADDAYDNIEGHLPTNAEYLIYDVPARPDDPTRGTRRVVIGSDGKWYYTNTHYGDRGGNPFYRLK